MDRLPGFRDFYPDPPPQPDLWSADARQYIFEKWRTTARCYGFREYDGPPLEPLELFTTKSGEEIVGQLYNFTDKGRREIALRPEMTPTLARMVAAHERSYKKPIKWFTMPQLFRYERQQKGRLREHFQLNADILGEPGTGADAELIALLIDTLRAFNLTSEDFVIRLSSRNAWHQFFTARKADPSKEYEFYQIIDKLEREQQQQSEEKLQRLGFSMAEVNSFIEKGEPTAQLASILESLAARGLKDFVRVDYHVIRGLAYYTGVVLEAFDKKGEFRAIAGGGRYDNLVKLVSGGKVDLPALGFGMGDVVLLELLRARGLLPQFEAGIEVFVLIEDESLRPQSLQLVQTLRSEHISVEYALAATKPDKQFKRAQELKAKYVARILPGEPPSVAIRNLKTREEASISPLEVLERIKQPTKSRS
jgi:histidyl-tRNA synthetase